MISISISHAKSGEIQACAVSGHAEYDDPGYDIVCAAVSVLTCTAILGLQEVAKQNGQYSNGAGKCDIALTGEFTQSGQDILKTMILGLQEICKQYPEFVKFSDK